AVTELVDVGGEFGELVGDFIADLADATVELAQLGDHRLELFPSAGVGRGQLLHMSDERGQLRTDLVDFSLRRPW
ncbi:MAG: hypothetical protein ACO292_10725, partial [Ilumatobacteraceae bacterium]